MRYLGGLALILTLSLAVSSEGFRLKREAKPQQAAGDDHEVDGRLTCGKTVMAFKKTCGKKADGCETCVHESFSKLEDACGEKAARVAPWICKSRGRDPDGDNDNDDDVNDRRTCGKTVRVFKKTCGKKADGCETCVRESFSKLEETCGEKAARVAPWICKRLPWEPDEDDDDEDKVGQTEDEDEDASLVQRIQHNVTDKSSAGTKCVKLFGYCKEDADCCKGRKCLRSRSAFGKWAYRCEAKIR